MPAEPSHRPQPPLTPPGPSRRGGDVTFPVQEDLQEAPYTAERARDRVGYSADQGIELVFCVRPRLRGLCARASSSLVLSIAKDDIQSGITISGYILTFVGFCVLMAQLDISLSNPVVHKERPRESRS